MQQEELLSELQRLFQTARTHDEFEFVNILIGYNGMGDQRALTHLYESRAYIDDMKAQLHSANVVFSKARLGLHIYCHIFEMNELYNIIGNLLRLATGERLRYKPDLYNRRDEFLTPTEKFLRLEQLGKQCRFEDFVNSLNELYFNEIRNSFVHSSYSLIEDEFCIVNGNGITINGQEHSTVSLSKFLSPLVDRSISFIDALFKHIDENKISYRENKIVEARMPELQKVVILGSQNGLIGFQTFVGSWIKIREGYGTPYFVEAMNLTFGRSPQENDLGNKLANYIEKLVPHGKEFEKIKEEVLAKGDKNLLHNLAIVYYNHANNAAATASGKPIRQQDGIYKSVFDRYDLAIQTDPTLARAYLNKGTAMLRQAKEKNGITMDLRQEVLALFDQAISLDVNLYEAWLNSARILSEIGNFDTDKDLQMAYFKESIARYRKAIEIYPRDGDAYSNLGWIFRRLAHLSDGSDEYFNEALTNYEMAVRFDSTLEANLNLATALAECGENNVEHAEKYLRQAIDILQSCQKEYGNSADLSYRLGNKKVHLGKLLNDGGILHSAIPHFEKAIELDAVNIKAMNNWGHCELIISILENDASVAISLLESGKKRLTQVIQLDPAHDAAFYNLGLIDIELAKRENVKKTKETILSIAILNLEAANNLAPKISDYDISRAYALLGNDEQAVNWLKKWLDAGNAWDSASFTEDFDLLKDNPAFSGLFKN